MKATDATRHAFLLMSSLLVACTPCPAAEQSRVAFVQVPGKVAVTIDGKPAATYVYDDQEIPRPYFAHVRGPGGIQVTRSHPPVPGKDPTDHGTYHPGIWMAFGDLNGSDYWRNRARVVHEGFSEKPTGGRGEGSFAVRNRYLVGGGGKRVHCRETCRYTIHVREFGYLLIWDSAFSAQREFCFGDQEEMGLGVRVATAITVKSGGKIFDSQGRINERQVWGEAADWCDYSGTIGGQHVGITLMAHPANFRPSWFHARDYGLLAANPFGRKAFHKGAASQVVVEPGTPFRLRYAVLLHAGPAEKKPDLNAAYADYLQLTAESRPLKR